MINSVDPSSSSDCLDDFLPLGQDPLKTPRVLSIETLSRAQPSNFGTSSFVAEDSSPPR